MTTIGDFRIDRAIIARLLVGIFLIGLMIAGPGIYGRLTSDGRVDAALSRAGGAVNVQVVMGFVPQGFHQTALSRFGVFGGIDGQSVALFNVSQAGLGELERIYWIDAVRPFRRS